MQAANESESGGSPARNRLTRTVVRGVGVSSLGYVLTQTLTLVVYLVLARLLEPQDFGEFAAGAVLVNIAILVVGLESGILDALVQRRDRIDEAAATGVVATFAAGIGFSLLALAASPLVGAFFDSSRIGAVAAASSGLLFLRTVTVVPLALLQRRFSFVRRVIVEPIGVAVFGAVTIIATLEDMGVWSLVIGTYAQYGVDVLLSWGFVRWRPRLRSASMEMWRELVAFARQVFAGTVVLRVGQEAPALILGRFTGAAALGQYRYAARIASLPFGLLLSAASYVLLPAFARVSEDPDRNRLRAAFIRSLRWVTVIGAPAGMLLLALGKPMTILVFGSVWEEAGEAVMVLCVYPIAGTLAAVVSNLYYADGRPREVIRMHAVEVGVGVGAMLALVGIGLLGVAAGVAAGLVATAVYSLEKARRLLELPASAVRRELATPLIAAAVAAAVALPIEFTLVHAAELATAPGLAALVAEATLALVIYAGVLHRLAPGYLNELRDLIGEARRRAGSTAVAPTAEGALEAETEPPVSP